MKDGKTKQNKTKYKSQCKIKHGLCLARENWNEMDARTKFAEHERNELLEVKPIAILASRVFSKLPLWIHNTIFTR